MDAVIVGSRALGRGPATVKAVRCASRRTVRTGAQRARRAGRHRSRIVDDVIWGCVMQAGSRRSTSRGRPSSAGWPGTVPSVTVDRQCGSSQRSVHSPPGVVASHYDVVIAAAGIDVADADGLVLAIADGLPGAFKGRAMHPLTRASVRR